MGKEQCPNSKWDVVLVSGMYLPGNKQLRKCESIGWLSIEEM